MKIHLFNLLLFIILITGCNKSELLRYTQENNIYFLRGNGRIVYDTIYVNFAFQGQRTTDSTGFYVYLMGKLAGNNRLFSITKDSNQTTALADKHYHLPIDDSCYIPANETRKWIPLTIFRPTDLYGKSVSLTLKLQPNENFKTNITTHSRSSITNLSLPGVASANTLKIIIEDVLPEPVLWGNHYNILGPYTRKKLEYFVKIQSLNLEKFYYGTAYTTAMLTVYARRMQIYLNRQKNAGQAITEADGTDMKMGPAVQ